MILVLAALAGIFYFYFFHVFTPTPPALTGAFQTFTVSVGGRQRSFGYYIPAKTKEHPAIVFVLHGSRGTGEEIRRETAFEFDSIADAEGFIVVYPDGYDKHWNDCRASAKYKANIEKVDDIGFFSEMLRFFDAKYALDPRQTFVMGFSNGGHMAFGLAYEVPEKIAAIAVIGANLPVENNLDCNRRGRPVSVAILNGTLDPMNPYNGGLVTVLGDSSRGAVIPTRETAEYWVRLAAIAGPGERIVHEERDDDPRTSISEVRWDNGRIQVRLYTMTGSGHVVASNKVHFGRFYGAGAADIEAPMEIWSFFAETAGRR